MFERFKVEQDGADWYITYAPAEDYSRSRLFKYLAWHKRPEDMRLGAQAICDCLNANLPDGRRDGDG